jgi:hypothetical protein
VLVSDRQRSQWPCGPRRGSEVARLLGLWVRIPPGAWMSVCCECLCCQAEVSVRTLCPYDVCMYVRPYVCMYVYIHMYVCVVRSLYMYGLLRTFVRMYGSEIRSDSMSEEHVFQSRAEENN